MGFSRQEYWSGLPFPSPGDLPNSGIKPGSPALQTDALTPESPGKPHSMQQPSKSYLITTSVLKFEVPSKSDMGETQGTIRPEAKFLFSCKSVKTYRSYAMKYSRYTHSKRGKKKRERQGLMDPKARHHFKLVLEKAKEPKIKLPTSTGSSKKQESSRKTSISALLTMAKHLTVWITINWKILKEMGIPDHMTCLLRNLYAGQEAIVRTGHGITDWFQIGKGVCQSCILSSAYLTYMQSTS